MYNYTYTPVTVKVVCTILYLPETSLQWEATYLTFNPKSRFPDRSAESTEEDCIGKALTLASLGLADMGIKPLTSCVGGKQGIRKTNNFI